MNGKGLMVASAAAALFLGGAVAAQPARAEGGDQVVCFGINSCKGTGSCHTAKNECAGKNGCKGQGNTETTAADCTAKGGTIVTPEKQ